MQFIHSPAAPAAIGPYSQAVCAQGLLFVSGQIALSVETGSLVGHTVEEQTKQCLKNLEYILKEGGSAISSILKVVIYLKNMQDFAAVNSLYEAWLQGHRPARATIAVAGLPRDALVEIECVAATTK
jgi:2-iminobutanoate/2-iminopropanoate deaminase